MFRRMRMLLAFCVIVTLTAFFLDFSETIPPSASWVAKIQLVPVLTSALGGAFLSVILLVVLLLVNLLCGRVYCSCICPFGIMQDVISRISIALKGRKNYSGYCYVSPHRRTRLFFLLLILTALFLAVFGMTSLMFVVGLLDPYAQYGRIVVHIFYPLYACGNNLLVSVVRSMGSSGFYLVGYSMQSCVGFVISCLSFVIVVYLASCYGRLYCNSVCPVGTFLGILSRKAFFRIHIDSDKCVKCNLCVKACKSGCINVDHGIIENDRCVLCFNCLDICTKGAIQFSSLRKKDSADKDKNSKFSGMYVDTQKREFLLSVCIVNFFGLLRGLIPKAFALTFSHKTNNVVAQNNYTSTKESIPSHHRVWHAVSPPGSLSLRHLTNHCTLCHLCVSKCPQHVIRPAFLDFGVTGMLLPVMKFSPEVFCNYDCTICGEVCPTGAIVPLTLNEKHLTQTGHVVFFKDKCVVYTAETNCGACAEHCPTQAVSMVDYKGNLTIPETRKEFCVGCGACESICPVLPVQAIRVKGYLVHRNAELPPQERKVEAPMDDFGF